MEQARMLALEQHWGWYVGAPRPRRITNEEKDALRQYYKEYGKVPDGLKENRHTHRNILRMLGVLTPSFEKRRQMDA